jgi:hypothetical protein
MPFSMVRFVFWLDDPVALFLDVGVSGLSVHNPKRE